MNRISVLSADDAINAQARTYAEYRVFAAVARHTRRVSHVQVILRPAGTGQTCDAVACAVTVTFEPEDVLTIKTTGPHAYAAINRAIDRLGRALERHVEPHFSAASGLSL